MLAATHPTGRQAALARLRFLRPPTSHAPRALAPDAAAGESADPLYSLCACGHTYRSHLSHRADTVCTVGSCHCTAFVHPAHTGHGHVGAGAVPSHDRHRAHSRGVRGDTSSRPAEQSVSPSRGEVLGALVDIEDAIEAGDRPRAREGMAHLRQALDSLPF